MKCRYFGFLRTSNVIEFMGMNQIDNMEGIKLFSIEILF